MANPLAHAQAALERLGVAAEAIRAAHEADGPRRRPLEGRGRAPFTEAGLSKHLRQLAQAGVLTTRRDGYYVLYSVDVERLAPLSETLLAFLQADGG